MSVSHRRRKISSRRKLRLEQLETRRVFAGLDFDFALPIGNGTASAAANAVIIDAQGNTLVTGSFRGTVDFDPKNFHQDSADLLTALGTHSDIFVAKYSPSGELEWARGMGSDNLGNIESERGMDIIVDANGNAYLTGDFYRQVTLGTTLLTSNGSSDAFVVKVDSSGDVLWATSWGTTGPEVGRFLAFAADGDLLVSSAAPNNVTPLQKLDSSTGDNRWQVNLPSSGLGNGAKIAVDTTGSIFVSNAFSGTIDADPGVGTVQVTTGVTSQSTYLLKLSDAAEFEWVRTFENQLSSPYGSSYPTDLVIDSAGNVLLAGGYRQQVDFDPSSQRYYQLPVVPSGSYLAKFDSSGTWHWAVEGTGPQIVVGENDAIYTIGTVVQKRDASGKFLWEVDTVDQSSLNSATAFSINSAAITADGKIQISGTFNGSLDFDAGAGNTTFNSSVSTGYMLSLKDGQGSAPLTLELFSDDFDVSEWNGVWVEDSQDDWFRSTQRSTLGGYSAEVDGSANNASLTTANVIDLTGVEKAELTFDWFIESGFDAGEYLSLDISTNGGTSWTQDVRRLNGNVSVENVWHSEVVDLTPYMSANTKIRFRSKVSASDEDANVDNVRITGIVREIPNAPPLVDARTDQTVYDGDGTGYESVTVVGYASDSDGSIVALQWSDGATVLGQSATLTTTLSVGVHNLTFKATDNEGATSSDTVTVYVLGNRVPNADAGSDITIIDSNGNGSENVTLNGSASDSDGSIISYQWSTGSIILGNTASISTTMPIGTHVLTLTVTDNGGASTSDDLIVTISNPPSETPIYVYDIRFESGSRSRTRAVFEIRSDSNGDNRGNSADTPVSGVTITVEFAGQRYSGTTDSNGIFRTDWLRNVSRGSYAEVVDFVLEGFYWDPLLLDLEDDTDGDGRPDAIL